MNDPENPPLASRAGWVARFEPLRHLWPAAAPYLSAGALILCLGFWAGLYAAGPQPRQNEPLMLTEGGSLIARGALHAALETQVSLMPYAGDQASAPPAAAEPGLAPLQTFRATSGLVCREYASALSGGEPSHGVACRKDGRWVIKMHLAAEEKDVPDKYGRPGGQAERMLNSYIRQVRLGDSLPSEKEEALIAANWDEF
jgi:hypothetical protein